MTSESRLYGRKVLVVEDEMLVSMLIEDVLCDQCCTVVGPFDRLPGALDAARHGVFDLAILDVNIRGAKIYPVAEILEARGIPFILLSGYGQDAAPPDRRSWRACSKPFRVDELIDILCEQIGRA